MVFLRRINRERCGRGGPVTAESLAEEKRGSASLRELSLHL